MEIQFSRLFRKIKIKISGRQEEISIQRKISQEIFNLSAAERKSCQASEKAALSLRDRESRTA
jgi:hypothetical protein